jgi:hypothetical protein
MPRIRDSFTGIAVYIYGSLDEAKSGDTYSGAGSGFIVEVNHETNDKHSSLYVVTNKHVVMKAHTPVIRFNRKDGTTPECFPTREDQWIPHKYGDDVAVFPMDRNWERLQFHSVNLVQFVSPQRVIDEDIGIGDDTIMVGRFITHEGRQQNSPSVRYGNIAMMNKETIRNTYLQIDQESFLVETRSLPGYSGSAVLLWSPCAMNDMSERRFGRRKADFDLFKRPGDEQLLMANIAGKGPYLLGIDWCHLQSEAYVKIGVDSSGKDIEHPERWFVRQNSGMAGVIPAWKIADVLKSEELMEQRRRDTERMNRDACGVSLDVAEGTESATQKTKKGLEIPVPTESQFFDDLEKASRKK